ncbi:hypothetical protein [Sphingobium sp.]|uniref:hypothetical protein n=1 Tax=Sphingobium sp. TaxID=1912891 RepID=UPI002CF33EE4|nr:hypothetical protein [Sphingobium sp.]HUD91229.1 hypothetical protein [Sphingobium sp.]
MTPLERAARALARLHVSGNGRRSEEMIQQWEDQRWPTYLDDVRAVLSAIRTPSAFMCDAGWSDLVRDKGSMDIWPAMLDALLEEGE